MKLKINESLKKATAYMLRNDGKLFELDKGHPYIWGSGASDLIDLFDNCYGDLFWLYHNTKEDYTRELMKKVIHYVVDHGYDDDILSRRDDVYYIKRDFDDIDFDSESEISDSDEAYDICDEINTEINNEFLRIRTSDEYFGGNNKDCYFRVSSDGFNWFDLIWKFVNENKRDIDTVTIERDDGLVYDYKNQKFDHMPTEEFLTLSGNPVIERFKK